MTQALRLLTFLAFLTQVWIPAGFMPGAQGRTMVICSGMDQVTISLDDQGQPVDHPSDKSPCAYTVLSMAGLAGYNAAIVPVAVSYHVMPVAVAHAPVPPLTLYRPHAAAPPSLPV